jgi:hypothetical protein
LTAEQLARYELAYLLHKTVDEIEDMSYTEFLGWQAYFEVRPVGWREDLRVMPLLQIKGVTAKGSAIFPSLIPILDPPEAKLQDGMISTASLKRSAMFSKMLGAVGGDSIPMGE